jgi:hypothetical protein
MEKETRDHWLEFCAEAAFEQDPKRLRELGEEIQRLPEEEVRLEQTFLKIRA